MFNAVSVSLANSFGKGKTKYIEKPISFKQKGNMEERLKAEFGAFAERLKDKLCS